MVKLSISSPVVTLNPGSHGPWELNATIEDLAKVAETADRLGYHHLTCSEHIALPATELGRRGARYWDPLATLGFLAARTHPPVFVGVARDRRSKETPSCPAKGCNPATKVQVS